MVEINASELNLTPTQAVSYFNPVKFRWGLFSVVVFVLICILAIEPIFGFIGIIAYASFLIFRGRKKTLAPADQEIDELWAQIAKQREDEAYRVAHIDKSDAIREAQYFYTGPWQFQSGENTPDYKVIVGKDDYCRRNYQQLHYMIYTQDQLVVFDESICIEDNWQGADKIREYYWKDVSAIEFDQKDNTLTLTCGGQNILFPLQGDKDLVQGIVESIIGGDEKFITTNAEEVSNSIRVMLREIKTS